ncbi:hypothetical protein, partial [Klebsiella oxytoca]|uniref:hypothetical protein n=1 Tax=Klebsiella oxytoca TaxID=571 RepID=UPI0013D69E71
NGGGFCFWLRVEAKADECLSTTLHPKESGLTVSFNFSANPCQQWRGFLLLASGLNKERGQYVGNRAAINRMMTHTAMHSPRLVLYILNK